MSGQAVATRMRHREGRRSARPVRPVARSMRFARVMFIHTCNVAMLIFVFLAVPAITRIEFGSLHVGSNPAAEMLTLLGVGTALVVNLGCGLGIVWPWGGRALCWRWTAIWVGIITLELLCFNGLLEFGWLKNMLLAVRDWVS